MTLLRFMFASLEEQLLCRAKAEVENEILEVIPRTSK